GAGDEIRDDGVHGDAAAFDQDSGLPGAGERDAMAACLERRTKLQGGGHLADVAIGADGEHDRRVDVPHTAGGDDQIARRLAEVTDRDAMSSGKGGEFGIISDEEVKSAPDLESLLDGRSKRLAPGLGKD